MVSGRFHLAANESSGEDPWPALYLALDLAVSIGEVQRNLSTGDWDSIQLTEIAVDLEAVVDCRDLVGIGIDPELLFDDWDFSAGQAVARAVRDAGAEGMLVPSATRLGDNLILFPNRLRTGSTLTVVRTVEPDLTKAPR